MRYFSLLILFLCFVAFGLAGLWLLQNNSPLELVWLGYEIRTTVAFVVFTLFVLSILFLFIGVAVLWLIRLPSRTVDALGHRRHDQGLLLLTNSLIAYASGQHEEALQLTAKATKRLPGQKVLPTLIAAEIAKASGDSAAMRRHYGELLQHKETEFVGLKGLMLQAQKDKDYPEMLSLGVKAKALRPKDLALSALLFHAYKQQRRWADAEKELDQLVKGSRGGGAQALALQQASLKAEELSRQKGLLLFQRAREAFGRKEWKPALTLVLQALEYVPDLPPLLLLAAQIAAEAKAPRKVRKKLQEAWSHAPHPDLARAFLALYAGETAARRLKLIEAVAEDHPDWVDSHRLVAISAIEARDWVKARNHLKAALAQEETASLCQMMGQIAREEREYEQAEQWNKRAMLAAPDPLWICQSCGFHTLHWDVFCTSCNSWDSFSFEVPHSHSPAHKHPEGRTPLLLGSP